MLYVSKAIAKSVKSWFHKNMLNIVACAWTNGYGDVAYRSDIEKLLPKKLYKHVFNIHVPRHRDGEFVGNFRVLVDHETIEIECTELELKMCKAHYAKLTIDDIFRRIKANDPFVLNFYEETYQFSRKHGW